MGKREEMGWKGFLRSGCREEFKGGGRRDVHSDCSHNPSNALTSFLSEIQHTPVRVQGFNLDPLNRDRRSFGLLTQRPFCHSVFAY